MKYEHITRAEFIERENRFVARVRLSEGAEDPDEVRVHVKNTGRCRELLVPGATVYLEDHYGNMSARKYRYSLIAVEKKVPGRTILINMDSQAPNKAVGEAIRSGDLTIFDGHTENAGCSLTVQPEKTYGNSRFDFYVEYREDGEKGHKESPESYMKVHEREKERIHRSGSEAGEKTFRIPSGDAKTDGKIRRAFVEVKGVTLEKDGIAMFPDAPTQRGVRHIRELEKALTDGYEAYIIFLVQMNGMKWFEPNDETHPEFGEALRHAKAMGVRVQAYDCTVTADTLRLNKPVEVVL